MKSNQENIRFIGDMHGNIDLYNEFVRGSQYSIQVGDLGFDYSKVETLNNMKHIVITGNHDNYDLVGNYDNFNTMNHTIPIDMMFVRGAFSPDYLRRKTSKTKIWWDNEELSYKELEALYDEIVDQCPRVIVSHDAPKQASSLIPQRPLSRFGIPDNYISVTQRMLTELFDVYQPELWVFGHWHYSLDTVINGTRFVCVNQESYVDLLV